MPDIPPPDPAKKKDIRLVRTTQFRRASLAGSAPAPPVPPASPAPDDPPGEDPPPDRSESPEKKTGAASGASPEAPRKFKLRPLVRSSSGPHPSLVKPSLPRNAAVTPVVPAGVAPPGEERARPAAGGSLPGVGGAGTPTPSHTRPPAPAVPSAAASPSIAPPAAPAPGLKELAPRPGLKRPPPRHTALPGPAIPDPAREEELKKGPPGSRPEDLAAARSRANARNMAILLFLLGQAVSLSPQRLVHGPLPVGELGVAVGTTLVLALLIISRKTPLILLAGVIAGINLLAETAVLALILFKGRIPAIQPLASRLPGLGIAGAAIALFLAAFILLTGGGAFRWTAALLLSVFGLVLPWTPLAEEESAAPARSASSALPAGKARPASAHGAATGSSPGLARIAAGDLMVPAPKGWKEITEKAGARRVFRSPDSLLTAVLIPGELETGGRRKGAFLQARLAELRRKYPGAGEMISAVPGHPKWRKISMISGKDQVEAVVGTQNGRECALVLMGTTEAFRLHRDEIDTMVRAFCSH